MVQKRHLLPLYLLKSKVQLRLKYKWTRKRKRNWVFRWNPPKTTTCHITTFFFLLFASETLVVDQKHTNTLVCKVGTVLAICILIFKSPTLKGDNSIFEKYFIPDWQTLYIWQPYKIVKCLKKCIMKLDKKSLDFGYRLIF